MLNPKIGREFLDRLFEFVNSTEEKDLIAAKKNLDKRIRNAIEFDEPLEDWYAIMSFIKNLERVKERFK